MEVLKIVLCVALLTSQATTATQKRKRQIFREQVSPHTGGKIPEDAFRTDRLALNRLNKEGVSVPDGVLLEMRHRESHHPSHRNDPSINESIVKLVQHPDGRYVPPEGRYPYDNLIESTYVIRPPWGSVHNIVIPPHKTLEVPLVLPNRAIHAPSPLAPSYTHEDIISFTNQLDSFYPDDLTNPRVRVEIWSGFGSLFPDHPARFLRQTNKKLHTTPKLSQMPKTSFSCQGIKGRMVADKEANCQVFHLCHTTGEKESFLCPQGMRFDSGRSQCMHWAKVTCRQQP